MLEINGYLKNYFKIELEVSLDTIPENYHQSTCWLCEKEFKLKDVKEKPVVKHHCPLTGKFKGLAHNNCNLNTQKAHTSFVRKRFHNFSAFDCHLIFEKLYSMSSEKGIKIKEEDIIAKSSENYVSVKIGCLKFLDSYRYLDASLDKLSTTLKSFPSLDAIGMEDASFNRKLAYPYEKGKTIGSFYKPLILGREDYFSSLKQSYPDFEEIIRTQDIIIKKDNQLKGINYVIFKKRCVIINRYFPELYRYKKSYGINPLSSYSTPSFTWKAGLKMTRV